MRRPALAVAIAVALCAAPLAAQGAEETAGFLWRLGTDTTEVERFTRAPGRLSGVHLTRVPETIVRAWSADVGPDGSVRRYEQTLRRRGAVASHVVLTFTGDSVTRVLTRRDSTFRSTLAAPAGTVIELPNSYAFYELALRRVARRDSLVVPLVTPGGNVPSPARFILGGGDTVSVLLEGLPPITLRVDREGRILWANNLGTIVERVPPPDMDALATTFAARPLGFLSPADTARAVIAGAHVVVDYSRPARRGRAVFGGLVPWDKVWRTGANRTTTLITDADLVIGGVTVPAGSYSLWTIPAPSGWTLIINGHVGGGLTYLAEHDLARVPLPAATVPELVERFTIAIEPRDGGGVLSFAWEHTRASINVGRR